jgi:hypothetical protein
MSWLTPGLAAIAAAIAVPTLLILYFLKLRRRDVEVSSTLLWKRTVQDMQANAPFQKLRRNLLLFLQLLILAAGLFAIAQPELSAETVTGNRHVIMIDRSASMQAFDGNWSGDTVTRLEQAKREALAFVDALAEPTWLDGVMGGTEAGADKATVITFDSQGGIRQPMTADKGLLRSAIESIDSSDAPTAAAEAYRLAIAQAPPRSVPDRDGTLITLPPAVGTVHLWTDGKIADARDVIPGPEDVVRFNRMGGENAINVGITGLRAERSYENPRELSIFVGLSNTETKPRTIDVQFIVNGSLASVRTAEIAAAEGAVSEGRSLPGTGGIVFKLDRAAGAVVEVRTKVSDGGEDLLDRDNTGWIVVPPSKRLRVAIVSPGDFFTTLALEGLPFGELVELTPDEFEAMGSGASQFDAVLLDGWLPDGPLPAGNYLVLGGVPNGLGLTATGEQPMSEIVDWNEEHPVMADLELGGRVTIPKALSVEVEQGAAVEILAETNNGPVIFDVSTGSTRAIVVAFDPDNSTWPFDVSYVVFHAASINSLGGVTGSASSGNVRPGGTLSERLPIGARNVKLAIPNAPDVTLAPAPDGRVAYGPIPQAGVYALTWNGAAGITDELEDGTATRRVAVNLLDPDETDIRSSAVLSFASGDVAASATGSAESPRRLWPWLLLGALAISMFEWWIYNRRVYL